MLDDDNVAPAAVGSALDAVRTRTAGSARGSCKCAECGSVVRSRSMLAEDSDGQWYGTAPAIAVVAGEDDL